MAESKSGRKAEGARRPLERVIRIHEMVNRGNFPNCNTIARELEVNRKTIQRDVTFMRDELDLPLEYNDQQHGYYYTRPVNQFPLLKTTAEDLVAIILARNALDPLRGSAMEATLRNGFQRLQASMKDQVTIPTDIDQAFSVQSTGMTERDLFLFNRLAQAVLESRELTFEYRKLNADDTMKRHLQPYHLTEIDGGWYLIGYDLDRGARRTFAVQRMKGVQLTKRKFIRSRDFKLEDHFAGSFGVWSGDENKEGNYEVKIRFTGFAARVVAERRWHPSQEIKMLTETGSEIELTMHLKALQDISRWVMGFGAQAEVLAPEVLRKELAKELSAAAAKYG